MGEGRVCDTGDRTDAGVLTRDALDEVVPVLVLSSRGRARSLSSSTLAATGD